MICIRGGKMESKYEKYLDIIFYIASLLMMFHFTVESDGWPAIICLWIFILYFMWYDIYAKNKKLAIIPLWLYLIGYYIINWATMLKVFDFWRYILFGWIK